MERGVCDCVITAESWLPHRVASAGRSDGHYVSASANKVRSSPYTEVTTYTVDIPPSIHLPTAQHQTPHYSGTALITYEAELHLSTYPLLAGVFVATLSLGTAGSITRYTPQPWFWCAVHPVPQRSPRPRHCTGDPRLVHARHQLLSKAGGWWSTARRVGATHSSVMARRLFGRARSHGTAPHASRHI